MKYINFFELENIIQNIIERVNCPKCNIEFTPQDLSVMGTNDDKCLISGMCHNCSCPMAITINVSRANQQMNGQIHVPSSQLEPRQMVDSITNINPQNHEQDTQFWQQFDGNFEALFKEAE